jgi:hypothetical protein
MIQLQPELQIIPYIIRSGCRVCPSPMSIGCLGLFPLGIKQLGHEGDPSLPSSAEVMNEGSFTCTALHSIVVCMVTALFITPLAALCPAAVSTVTWSALYITVCYWTKCSRGYFTMLRHNSTHFMWGWSLSLYSEGGTKIKDTWQRSAENDISAGEGESRRN